MKWSARDVLKGFFPQAWIACKEPRGVDKRCNEAFGVPSLRPGTVFDGAYRYLVHGTSTTIRCLHTSPQFLNEWVSGEGEALGKNH